MERLEFIKELIEKKPEHYLRTLEIKLDGTHYHIGLFTCSVCNKPITDEQFNFARTCGSCDVGNDNKEWIIEKPVDDPDFFEKFSKELPHID